MKVIVAGGRDFNDYEFVKAMLDARKSKIDVIVSGGAKGADALGERWARENNIPIVRFPADWEKYGRMAGPRRNQEMADYADALVAFPGGRGTADMIRKARAGKLKIANMGNVC